MTQTNHVVQLSLCTTISRITRESITVFMGNKSVILIYGAKKDFLKAVCSCRHVRQEMRELDSEEVKCVVVIPNIELKPSDLN